MKKCLMLISITLNIFLIIIDWCQWDIIYKLNERYNHLISGLFFYFILLMKFIIVILIIIGITGMYINRKKVSAIIVAILFMCNIALQSFVPVSETYVKINFKIQATNRQKIISMFDSGNVSISQRDENSYLLPLNIRLASHDGEITVNNEKIMFFVHRGIFKNSAVIYSPDTNISEEEFGFKIDKSLILEPNWCAVFFQSS